MRITGIEVRNFRSIGSEPVVLVPWRKCNMLVGQNNSGKSNVLRLCVDDSNALLRFGLPP